MKNLKLDHWSSVILAAGLILIFTALKTEVHAVSNLDLLVIAVGVSLIGLGEKLNYEWVTHVVPAHIYSTGGQTLLGEGYQPYLGFYLISRV